MITRRCYNTVTFTMPGVYSSKITKETQKWDLARSSCHGFLESTWTTFALLIAIRVFDAPESLKPLIPAFFGVGLLSSWFFTSIATTHKLKSVAPIAVFYILGAIAYFFCGISQHLWFYLIGACISMICVSQLSPFMAQVYATNYHPKERGQRVSTVLLTGTVFSALWAWGGGAILDANLNLWWSIFAVSAITALLAALIVMRIPSKHLVPKKGDNVFTNFKLLKEDKLFAVVLLGWWFIGIGNLMTQPIRVEYLANADYGINASNYEIGILLGTIPFVSRLFATKVWGLLFDKLNLITVRILLNLVFMASIGLFFLTKNIAVMTVASILFGFAYGGGGVMWLLWVTKVAPPEKVSRYMSVHATLTGVRATLAPFLGYFLLVHTNPITMSYFAIGSITLSCLIFLPLFKPMAERTAD